jgi:hypothetical protein
LKADPAVAAPSFARQTRQPLRRLANAALLELTPFGRGFKLAGCTLQSGDAKLPPVAAKVMPTFAHMRSPGRL